MADAGFVSSGPGEGCLSGIGSERPGREAPEVHLEKSPGTGGGPASQAAQRHTTGRQGTVEAGPVAGDDVIRCLVGDHGRRPLPGRQGVQELEAELFLGTKRGDRGTAAVAYHRWVSAEEEGREASLAAAERGVDRDVVAFEPHPPHLASRGAEDAEPVVLAVASVTVVPLQTVEHLVEAHDGDGPGVGGNRQQRGKQPVRGLALTPVEIPQRDPAAVGGA
ncbi:MAG TPA: hypothetical protein VG455_03850, partial [Acidimicrobiales bacterium]|nr:hypothetical protein [Acidimicrobiales bacterium]